MRARAPAPPTVWMFGVFSIVPLFIAAWVYCYGPLNLRGAGLLALLGYSTALLSFLGGVRCGLEFGRRLPRWRAIGMSLIAPFFAFFILSEPVRAASTPSGRSRACCWPSFCNGSGT